VEEKCGIFVLITTPLNMLTHTDREIHYQYKGQQSAENIFKFLKDPTFVGAYCLKNPERIVAFGYVLLMAAQVYTTLEREVRKSLENIEEEPVEGLNHNKTKKPTGYVIKYILSPILLIRKQNKKSEIWEPSKELSKNQKRILKLAGFDEQIYYESMKTGNYH
jgi:transposase